MNQIVALVEEADGLAARAHREDLLGEARALKDATWATSGFPDLFGGAVGRDVRVELSNGLRLAGRVQLVGVDFFFLTTSPSSNNQLGVGGFLVPLAQIRGLGMVHGAFALGGAVAQAQLHQGVRRLLSGGVCMASCREQEPEPRWQVIKAGKDWVGLAAKAKSAKEVNALEHGLIAPLGSVVVFALNAGVAASEVVAQLTGFDSPLPSSANL
jgi:hypothetical protein